MGSGGKGGGGGSKAQDYYGSIFAIFCLGPVDFLYGLYLDSKLVWPKADDFKPATAYALNALVKYQDRVWKWTNATPSMPGTTPPGGSWVRYQLARGVADMTTITVEGYGTIDFYWGTATQTLATASDPKDGRSLLIADGHPPYQRQCGALLRDFLLGTERASPPNLEALLARKAAAPALSGVADPDLDGDAQQNPLQAGLSLLFDAFTGPGATTAAVPAALTPAATLMDALDAAPEDNYVSLALTQAEGARVTLARLLSHFDGWARMNDAGELVFGRWPHEEAPPAFTAANTIDYHDLKEEVAWDCHGLAETHTAVTVRFPDRSRAFKPGAATAQSPFGRDSLGADQAVTVDRPYITRRDQATKQAAEWLKSASQPYVSGSLVVRAVKATAILPGDLFLLTHDAAQLSLVCRCNGKVIHAPPAGRVTLRFESDRVVAAVPFAPTPEAHHGYDIPLPEPVSAFQLVQLPYLLAGTDFGLAVLAARNDRTLTSLAVYFREADSTEFDGLGEQRKWAVSGRLASLYNGIQTTAWRERAGGVTTVSMNGSHGLQTGDVVSISGLGGTGFNGDSLTVTVLDGATFTYTPSGSPPDEPFAFDNGGRVTMNPLHSDPPDDLSEHLRLWVGCVGSFTRRRTSNVATVGTAIAHGLATGDVVSLSGLGGSGYNLTQVTVTVTSSSAFTYASPGSDESVTSDLGGLVEIITSASASVPGDLDRFTDQTEDAINRNNLLCFIFRAGYPQEFEVMSVRSLRVVSGVHLLKVRRSRFLPYRRNFLAGDRAFLIYRGDLTVYRHDSFEAFALAGTTATFRLQPKNVRGERALTDCADESFDFDNNNSPVIEWQSRLANGTEVTDFDPAFAPSTLWSFTLGLFDPNADLADLRVIARNGSVEEHLHGARIPGFTGPITTQPRTLPIGTWVVEATVSDAGGRQVTKALDYAGDPVFIVVVDAVTTVATPRIREVSTVYLTTTVELTCATSGATIEWQTVALYAAPGGSWTTYAGQFAITRPCTLYARAKKTSYVTSGLATAHAHIP